MLPLINRGMIYLTTYSVSAVGAASRRSLGGETPPLQQIIEGVKYIIPINRKESKRC
jgi:hypothetical protein